jgi:hypothetical protein
VDYFLFNFVVEIARPAAALPAMEIFQQSGLSVDLAFCRSTSFEMKLSFKDLWGFKKSVMQASQTFFCEGCFLTSKRHFFESEIVIKTTLLVKHSA